MFANCVHVKNDVGQNLLNCGIFFKALKCSSGHVECSFYNASENLLVF